MNTIRLPYAPFALTGQLTQAANALISDLLRRIRRRPVQATWCEAEEHVRLASRDDHLASQHAHLYLQAERLCALM